jgi:glycerate kinase
VSLVVAAADKFRGTATAREVSGAVARAARRRSWTVDEVRLADGGEGLLDALGGAVRTSEVSGPLGAPTVAEWRLIEPDDGAAVTAVIEMARAAGRDLLPAPDGDDPLLADTRGVGQLIVAALDAGATRIVVGCGGSASTDGGAGALEAIGSRQRVADIDLVAATDVTTTFEDAAPVFGPQKGASPAQVTLLRARLGELRRRYRETFGVDVGALVGGGAAGGLAGGLAAIGGRIVAGFDLVAEAVDLDARLEAADAVVTGEGRLDAGSFRGKVVGQVIAHVAGRCPVLVVVGDRDDSARVPEGSIEVVSLAEHFGAERARTETVALVEAVVADFLARLAD